MSHSFSRIEDALEAIAQGHLVIVVDSEDRENEGDFVAAAEKVTPQMIHLMITYGRGLVCMPVLPEVARRLHLEPMVAATGDLSVPRFTIPIDHRRCHTGISPLERAYTIQSVIDPESRPADFLRPGHLFPLIARPEGVLARTGHTEATVDLADLAGLTPAGVLCEVCSRDGLNMATRDELLELAAALRIPIITIDALVEYRRDATETIEFAPMETLVLG